MLTALADLCLPLKRDSFLRVLSERFYPALRAEGFGGSGTTLRRVQPPIVHVVNIQGSSSATEFYVNLGAHLLFLPTEGGEQAVPDRLHEADCAFRERIQPPARLATWQYRRTHLEPLREEWQRQGLTFFKRYSAFPEDFIQLVKASLRRPPDAWEGLKHARIARHVGLHDDAVALARASLANVQPSATTLRAHLTRLLEELGAAQ